MKFILNNLAQIVFSHFIKNLKSVLRCDSLQGLKYVCDNRYCYWVRAYFGVTFIIILTLALNLSLNVYASWERTPVIIAVSSRATPIQQLPFPAITICNMNQARYSKTAFYPNTTLEYAMLQKICFQETNYALYDHLRPKSKNDSFGNFILTHAQNCSEMIVNCRFGANRLPCTDFFREILLDEGMCCVFNLLHPYYLYKPETDYVRDYTSTRGRTDIPVDWNPITGYPKELPMNYYPRPAIGTGVEKGLQIVLNGDLDDYYCSSTNGPGFKILLYNPIDQPHIKESGLPARLGSQSNFLINMRSFVATPDVRKIDRKKRQCIFSNEQEMLFFRYYSRRNCEAECDAHYMLRSCKCITFQLPLIYPNATVCHVRHFNCVVEAEMALSDAESRECKEQCLPSCHDIVIFPDVYSTPFTDQDFRMRNTFFNNFSKEYINKNFALVNFYYNENFLHSSIKSSYTGLTEYMSLTGGIMSLMVGFSVIFIAESFYHFVMRPFFDYLRYRYSLNQKRIGIIDEKH